MNASSFLQCLSATGLNTGSYILGIYNFQSGDQNFVFNQLFSTGFNYYSGFPFAPALPLIFEGSGFQTSGNFSGSQPYQIANGYMGDFGVLMFLNNSGCLNTGNINRLLLSTVASLSGGNSGAIMGLTPSNRLYVSITGGFSQTAPVEIDTFDLAFLSIQQNRFVNFGSFNLKNNYFYRNTYDYGNSGITIQNLFVGGALNYSSNLTGYSGVMRELYLFNGNITDSYMNSCVNCVFCTGFNYTPTSGVFNQKKITGSYWSGIQQSLLTGYKIVSGNYLKTNGATGTIFYDSGLSGLTNIYSGLFTQSVSIPYTGYSSGLIFLYNTGEIISGLVSNLYFGITLTSGDIVEVYTYVQPISNLSVSLSYQSKYPSPAQSVQLYGNGLAETSGIDFTLTYGNYIAGYDQNDVLLYDIIPSSITMPYITGYILTGIGTATSTTITGISGINMSAFNYDIYLDGQKMISGINYSYTSPNLYVSGNDLFNPSDAPEMKFIPLFPNLIRNLIEITGTQQGIGTITGYNEQVWLNGLRQEKGLDYYLTNVCPFCSGFYQDPQFNFNLYNSPSDAINLFQVLPLF